MVAGRGSGIRVVEAWLLARAYGGVPAAGGGWLSTKRPRTGLVPETAGCVARAVDEPRTAVAGTTTTTASPRRRTPSRPSSSTTTTADGQERVCPRDGVQESGFRNERGDHPVDLDRVSCPACDEEPTLRSGTPWRPSQRFRLVGTVKGLGWSSSDGGQPGELALPTSDLYELLGLPLLLIGGWGRSVRAEALDFG